MFSYKKQGYSHIWSGVEMGGFNQFKQYIVDYKWAVLLGIYGPPPTWFLRNWLSVKFLEGTKANLGLLKIR